MIKKPRSLPAVLIVLLSAVFSLTHAADKELRQATEALISGAPANAVTLASSVLTAEPNSRLAHWLRAQSLSAMAGRPVSIDGVDQELIEEARVRLDVAPAGMLPKNLVVMPQTAEKNLPVLLADAERSRIYVFSSRNGQPQLIDEFYTSIGALGFNKVEEGDKKTPLGVYRIRYEIRDPRRDGFLGKMAMTLDYPNAYDDSRGRTGSGIWIHGVPDSTHVRPPKASDGCFALSNRDLQRLRRYVRYQETQIVVVPRVEWVSPKEWEANAVRAKKDFARTDTRRPFGIFFVAETWPWVLSIQEPQQFLREYWERPRFGAPRRLLREQLS